MPIHLYRSNRTEKLIEALARVVAVPLADPLAPETIVVQGKGMERWLSMRLAERHGVWANPEFPFPRKLIQETMNAVLGEPAASAAAFEPEGLVWSVARLLPELLAQPPFAPLHSYLEDDDGGRKRVDLAQRIAATLDHYVVYRPDLLRSWERNPGREWQAILWKRLVELHGRHHFAARAEELAERLERGGTAALDLPARVSLFGLSTLPPLYVELLHRLSAHLEVHLFLLSPSREYWADIRSRRDALRSAQARDGHLPGEDELAALEGNPLLASLGRLGREFQEVLEASVDYDEGEEDLYDDPGSATVLATLQSDVLHLAQRRPGGEPAAAPLPLRPGDRSVTVHACHGPMREVEVLHDQLLALFDADPTLEPGEVVVMTPAIDVYAPYVEAVFRRGESGRPPIPFRIADRSARATEEVSDALFRILDVLRGRLAASEVLDLLGSESIRGRFGFALEDVDLVRTWVTAAGIRWGVDADHRAEEGQPALTENTWRFGLDRLLLGWAIPGDGRALPYGVLPYDDVEGSDSLVLGRLASFCETLFRHRLRLRRPKPLAAWRQALELLLADLVADTNLTAYQHRQVREAIAAIAARAERAGFAEDVELEVVSEQLADELQRGRSVRGFLSGGITFCELVPMRTIPFRVVALLGMNDRAFPRLRRPLGFDLMAQQPRLGDRSVREDDRYLFLEAVLSARDRLLITYVGQSITDNSAVPPSVVVSELLDTIERSFFVEPENLADVPPADAVRRRIVAHHPLQPFSPRNFENGESSFGYSHADFEGARALVEARQGAPAAPAPFLSAPLPLVSPEPRHVDLERLARFFENPTRAFLQNRLGLYLGDDVELVEDREPLELNNLDVWKIGDTLLRLCERPEEVAATFALLRAGGRLPPGELGAAVFAAVAAEARELLQTSQPLRQATARVVALDGVVDGTRITGALRDLRPKGQVCLQFSRLGNRRELGFWIRHLVLNAVAEGEPARESFLVGRPPSKGKEQRALQFTAVDDAKERLAELLDLYWRGQEWPLPLFEKASRNYAEAAPKDADKALKKVAKDFEANGDFSFGADGSDAHVRQVYGDGVTLWRVLEIQKRQTGVPSFQEIAERLYTPLFRHRKVWP